MKKTITGDSIQAVVWARSYPTCGSGHLYIVANHILGRPQQCSTGTEPPTLVRVNTYLEGALYKILLAWLYNWRAGEQLLLTGYLVLWKITAIATSYEHDKLTSN